MAKLKFIGIERDLAKIGLNEAIRIDWDNDRHHRVEIQSRRPTDVIQALESAAAALRKDLYNSEI